MYTNSMCLIGAVRKSTGVLKPFIANRVSEVKRIRDCLKELTDHLSPIHHVPGTENPADLGTCGLARMQDLGPGSMWQEGPGFLRQPYSEWPVTSADKFSQMEAPKEEVKRVLFTVSQEASENTSTDLVKTLATEIWKGTALGMTLGRLAFTTLQREKLELSVRALARVLCAVLRNIRLACKTAPCTRMIKITIQVML